MEGVAEVREAMREVTEVWAVAEEADPAVAWLPEAPPPAQAILAETEAVPVQVHLRGRKTPASAWHPKAGQQQWGIAAWCAIQPIKSQIPRPSLSA